MLKNAILRISVGYNNAGAYNYHARVNSELTESAGAEVERGTYKNSATTF